LTWEILFDIGAELNILPNEFYDLTLSEIENYYYAYQIRQSKEWEKTRFLAYISSIPYRDKNKPFTQYDLLELMTDPTDEEKKEMAEEQRKENDKAIAAIFEHYKSQGYNV